MKKTKFTTRQLAYDALLAAMCAVLGFVSLEMGWFKISFESLPVFMAAMLFGPLDGLAVGGTGTLVYQLLRYGPSVTTVLWMLPYMLVGLVTGFIFRKQTEEMSFGRLLTVMIISGLIILVFNTLAMYVDSKMFGYYTKELIFGGFLVRIAVCVLRSVIFTALLPPLMNAAYRGLKK